MEEPRQPSAGMAVLERDGRLDYPMTAADCVDRHRRLKPEAVGQRQRSEYVTTHGPLARKGCGGLEAGCGTDAARGQFLHLSEAAAGAGRSERNADDNIGFIAQDRPEQRIGDRRGVAEIGIDEHVDRRSRCRVHAGRDRATLADVAGQHHHREPAGIAAIRRRGLHGVERSRRGRVT